MELIIYLLIVSLGFVFGSFMSVLVFRLNIKDGIISGRSECPKCNTRLKWYDLIPLFSFMFTGGKCRYCKIKISPIYPIMELAVAGSFLAYYIFSVSYLNIGSIYELAIIFILLCLIFFDYIYYILPDKVIFTGLAISVGYKVIFDAPSLINSSISGLALALFFAILYVVARGQWLGVGDVKLALLIGFILGYPIGILAIIIAVWAGAIWGMGMIVFKRANLKTALPFGVFMGLAAILSIIFKEFISQSSISVIFFIL